MACQHFDHLTPVTRRTEGCEECMKTGDTWIALRECLICGHVGCCDSSKNKHATKHFKATEHPVMRSAEPGQQWGWCYVDELKVPQVPQVS